MFVPDSPQSAADCKYSYENILCLEVGYSFNHVYTAVSRKVVLQMGKSLRDYVEIYYGR